MALHEYLTANGSGLQMMPSCASASFFAMSLVPRRENVMTLPWISNRLACARGCGAGSLDLVRVRDAGTFAEALPTGTSAVISRAPMMARTATTVGVALPLLLSLSLSLSLFLLS